MTTVSSSYENNISRARQDSSVTMAQPISMNIPNKNGERRPRSGSISGSLMQGTSLGGMSMGSWIRDDFIMSGTSPFPHQSPSFHSSSYLPKLEANFMRDFLCCGNTLETLHDLLQHYEESHAQQTQQSLHNSRPQENLSATTTEPTAKLMRTSTKASSASRAPAAHQSLVENDQNAPLQPRPLGLTTSPRRSNIGGIQLMRQQQQSQSQSPTPSKILKPGSDEMETVEDMELDDAIEPLEAPPENPVQAQAPAVQSASQSLFGQQPRLMLNLSASGLPHAGLRSSQPSTPSSAGFGFQNNPTVSSVNTPTLSAHPTSSSQQYSPLTSGPGTPAGETEHEFTNYSSQLNLNNLNTRISNWDLPYSLGSENFGADYCIDEPAKRLYSPNGFNNQRLHQQFAQFSLSHVKNEVLANAHRTQQMLALNNSPGFMISEEHKPFRCPVIGCEKAYKNQNGLKYHKTHGHNTQQLHENGDGTFSIVNPDTSTPYPGHMGMEKEKPYKCEACNKRYKNLNGLKYHKQHSPICNYKEICCN